MLWRQSFGEFLYYAHSKHKHFGRYNAACNFPVLLNKREKYFMLKGIYSSKGTYVRVKKEITKFCNKISMKVNLLVEFNGEK